MPDRQRTFGQFDTPPDVADLLLAFCLHRPEQSVLDPSCGRGAFLQRAALWLDWLAERAETPGEQVWGVELDPAAAQAAQQNLPEARILHENFFTWQEERVFDAVVGNPPYTRAEWIGRLQEEAGEQLAIFAGATAPGASAPSDRRESRESLIPSHLWKTGLNRRAGLYGYFFLHSFRFLREGGRLGFVVPNNWLDVAYGEGLKQFLLERARIVALIESTVERWFTRARVNTCLVVLEKCSDPAARAANPVRFLQLHQPLQKLLHHPPQHEARCARVAEVSDQLLLPEEDRHNELLSARVLPQQTLRPAEKWGVIWRAPAVYRRAKREPARRRLVPLKEWAAVHRGYTTGANDFFYLDSAAVDEWQIESEYRQPLLKSLRQAEGLRLRRPAAAYEVLLVPPTASIGGTAAAAYVAWGEQQGFHRRATCSGRRPWYSLPFQEPSPLVLPKGIWGRHLAPLLHDGLLVDQQLYQIHLAPGVQHEAAAALLNSAWAALQMELHGRANFGEGVLWLAGYEIQNLLLPDPRYLAPEQVALLARQFAALAAAGPSGEVEAEQSLPERQALDEAVFEVMGFSTTEAVVVLDSLLERVATRQTRSRS